MPLKARFTPEFIKETQRFWQDRTGLRVSEGQAEEALSNVVEVFDLLAEWDRQGEPSRDTGVEATEATVRPREADTLALAAALPRRRTKP